MPDAQSHEQFKHVASYLSIGQYKKRCPECQGQRAKHKHDTPLSIKVDTDGIQYHCHHCGANGGWMHNEHEQDPLDFTFDDAPTPKSSGVGGKQYLIDRGISEEAIEAHTVTGAYSFRGRRQSAIGFPYKASNAVKWRSTTTLKQFSQQNVCEDFFLLETYKPGNSILICEGEIDALAWLSAGLPDDVTVMSVPNGAPKTVSDNKVAPSEDVKFRYVFRAKQAIDSAPRIYLNTDNDGPGKALSEELSRRIGRAKSWVTTLPHKDAAETLMLEGKEALQQCLAASTALPMLGLHSPEEFDDDYCNLYENGMLRGTGTGLSAVDKLMSVSPGMVTIVTGFPGSGKSDLVDQFCLNMARDADWKTVFCSFEKPPILHMAQLAQKLTGKTFFGGSKFTPRMTETERDYALAWIHEHFMFMDSSKGGPSDIDGILDMASAAVMRMGCRILVVDPYNYISVDRKSGLETDAISDMLSKVRTWARQHDCHVFFVAHPAKPDVRSGKYICSGLDVSASMAWYAKADIGITAWRSPENDSELHVWKVRWAWMGTVGHCKLRHTPDNSRWLDYDYVPDDFDWDFD